MAGENPFRAYLEQQTQAPANPFRQYVNQDDGSRNGGIPIGDVPGMAAENFLPSLSQNAADIWHAITNPVETARGLGELGLGIAQQASVDPRRDVDPSLDFRDVSRAAGQAMADRYGGWNEIKRTIATDPAGVLLDVGSVAAPFGAGAAGKAASAAQAVRRATPTKRQFIERAPETETLRTEGGRLYDEVRATGETFQATDFDDLATNMIDRLNEEGAAPILSPKVNQIMGLLREARGRAPSIQDMETLRRQLSDAGGSPDPSERRLAGIGIEMVDDFVEAASERGSETLRNARGLWRRARKAEVIEEAIENATIAKEGIEAGLRNQFSILYRARNKAKMRGFTDGEIKAIKAVVDGAPLDNLLRRVGSLSGGTGIQRNMLNAGAGMGVVGGGIGALTMNPFAGALAAGLVPPAGWAAQRLAQRGTQGRADLARAMVASGEPIPGRRPSPVPGAATAATLSTVPFVARERRQ
ncbi:MAG: hypothetical protein OXD40_09445 [bacterium]|nr:hypothetical protein [bacterium]